jgi:hypothetical protein
MIVLTLLGGLNRSPDGQVHVTSTCTSAKPATLTLTLRILPYGFYPTDSTLRILPYGFYPTDSTLRIQPYGFNPTDSTLRIQPYGFPGSLFSGVSNLRVPLFLVSPTYHIPVFPAYPFV